MSRAKSITYKVILMLLVVMALVSVVQGVKNAINISTDFQYDSSKVFSMRINPYDETLNPQEVNTDPQLVDLKNHYDRLEANQFPSLLAILLPFVVFSPSAVKIVWAVVNVIMTAIMIVFTKKLFLRQLDNKLFLALCCLMLAGLGWRNNIGMGQHTIFAMAFFLLSVWLSEKNKTVLSSIALAISFFKYTITVPLALYFVYRKKYKELIISVAAHVVLTVLSAWWLDDSIFNMIIKPLKISSWLGDEGYIDFGVILKPINFPTMILTVIVMALCFAFAILLKNNKDTKFDYFNILCYVSLIVVYHRAYDFFILIIPVGIYLVECFENKKVSFEFIASTVIFLYSNFVSKAIVVVINMMPSISWINTVSRYVLAAMVYSFIVYLCINCFKKSKNKELQGA